MERFHENCAEMEGLAETIYVTYCCNNWLEEVTFFSPGLRAETENSTFELDVRGSVHRSTILTVENPTRCNSVIKILLFLILNKAQNVSGHTLPIIKSLKLHKQPLVLHTWKVLSDVQLLDFVRQRTFHVCKPRGCLCSFRLLLMGGVSSETF
jgi:hypothetical protein